MLVFAQLIDWQFLPLRRRPVYCDFPFRQFTFFQRVSNQRSFSFPLRGWSLLNVVLLVKNNLYVIDPNLSSQGKIFCTGILYWGKWHKSRSEKYHLYSFAQNVWYTTLIFTSCHDELVAFIHLTCPKCLSTLVTHLRSTPLSDWDWFDAGLSLLVLRHDHTGSCERHLAVVFLTTISQFSLF